MLRWRAMHPYNAVHVVRIDLPLDAVRLPTVIDAWLATQGVTGLVLDARRARYEYTGGPVHTALRVLDGEGDPEQVVYAEIERQLNEPFARDGAIDPFRFFAVDAGRFFHLGLAYDHFIAGGDAIVMLLKGLRARYTDKDTAPATPTTLPLYPATCRRLVLRRPWRVLRGMRHLSASMASGARAFRPRYPGGHEMRNGFVGMRIDAQGLASMQAAAKAWGATLNDLLMAMLLHVLSPLAEDRRGARRRKELAIASVINIRSEFGAEAATAFGQFLSSFHVAHRVPPGISLEQLARDVHAQSAAIKCGRLYYQTLLGMGVTSLIWPLLSPERRARFHAKSYPVWAGTTALNVDALWRDTATLTSAPQYIRGVSTGPLAPLVVAATTAGGALQFGFSYRTAAFDRETVDRIAAGIRRSIESLPA